MSSPPRVRLRTSSRYSPYATRIPRPQTSMATTERSLSTEASASCTSDAESDGSGYGSDCSATNDMVHLKCFPVEPSLERIRERTRAQAERNARPTVSRHQASVSSSHDMYMAHMQSMCGNGVPYEMISYTGLAHAALSHPVNALESVQRVASPPTQNDQPALAVPVSRNIPMSAAEASFQTHHRHHSLSPKSEAPKAEVETTEAEDELPVECVRHKIRDLNIRFNWFKSRGSTLLSTPPTKNRPSLKPGDVFTHVCIPRGETMAWVYEDGQWISATRGVSHPTLYDRVFWFPASGEPSWVTNKTYSTYKQRFAGK
ncbi:hypothetical protein PLICRDRAFT_176647 [Plicaturopsis crispa FD-325 SS-3]|nr:hypothetical protein PLICRDRAFT_176647 [Plicaturopsis crispa FD-325 SS-3]